MPVKSGYCRRGGKWGGKEVVINKSFLKGN